MDGFDLKLLEALQQDGRLTNFELAEQVGLSPSQCSRRRAALEASGLIESYHAHLSADAIGLGVLVFVQVTLATHSPGNSKRFQKLIDGLPEVQEAYSLTGEADYLIKLIIADLKALSRVLNDVLLPHESVAHLRSSIVLDRLKQTGALPLKQLEGWVKEPRQVALRTELSKPSHSAGRVRRKGRGSKTSAAPSRTRSG
jgi:DNA-binding Lrp family transcriptional regulator